jgi:hypothetical protein
MFAEVGERGTWLKEQNPSGLRLECKPRPGNWLACGAGKQQ